MVGLAITILRGSLPSPFPAAAPFFISKSRCSRSMPFFQRLAACSLPMPFFQRLLRLAVLETFFSKAELKVAFAFFSKGCPFSNFCATCLFGNIGSCLFSKGFYAPLLQRLPGTFFPKVAANVPFFQRLVQLFWVSSNLALKATASGLVKPLASICFFISAITFL